jgi:hypothetical protein
VTFNAHILALVADGVFLPSGTSPVLLPLPETALGDAMRYQVSGFPCTEGVLDTGLAERMLAWRHCGFYYGDHSNRSRGLANTIRLPFLYASGPDQPL